MDYEFGFDKERFPNLKDESYDCIICSEVVRNPKECTGCGNLFCSGCIDSWMAKKRECPNRCSPSDRIQPITKALLRMYNELDIKCSYFDKCGQTLKLSDIDSHEKVCKLPKCPNHDLCKKCIPENATMKTCSLECDLITKLKAANGDWGIVYKELKGYLTPFEQQINSNQVVFSEPNKPQAVTSGKHFKWNPMAAGSNIQITNNGTQVFLKEPAYIFKTVLGDQGFSNGVHYWEIIADPRTENELKIGVSRTIDFDPNLAFCDFDYGFAYYGLGQLRHGSNSHGGPYGKKFKKSGVLGVCLNMDKGTLSFALNGEFMGVAFQSKELTKGPIWPAIALLHCAGCTLVTGKPIPSYFV